VNATACTFNTVDSEFTRNAVRNFGGYPVSDQHCELLNKHKLKLHVTTDGTVFDSATVGWASVRLMDKNNRVSMEHAKSTYINTAVATSSKAEELVTLAIRDAVNTLNFNKAISQLK
jgi:hypothetical protein